MSGLLFGRFSGTPDARQDRARSLVGAGLAREGALKIAKSFAGKPRSYRFVWCFQIRVFPIRPARRLADDP
ncbi:hypothetical protein GC387_09395 [Pseudomonas sp. MWU12-2323]|nr:hypothetical protein [Pseudomonas sp. MWU12-2323]